MNAKIEPEAEAALLFLASHKLAATPQNYALAWFALRDAQSAVGRAVKDITSDGLRLRQADADRLFQLCSFDGAKSSGSDDENHDALRHEILKITELATGAARVAGDSGRDVAAEAGALSGSAPQTTRIVTRLVERAHRAESDLTAAALQVELLRQELDAARNDANQDALTGLHNRRGIEAHLQHLAATRTPRVIALCDIDHFKKINDLHGHGVGDRVLKAVADILREEFAPHFVGRWGGEEFIIVLSTDDPNEAWTIIEDKRTALSFRNFKVRETDEPLGQITFSAGFALAEGDHSASLRAIHQADKKLYRAKSAGRNRTFPAISQKYEPSEIRQMMRATG